MFFPMAIIRGCPPHSTLESHIVFLFLFQNSRMKLKIPSRVVNLYYASPRHQNVTLGIRCLITKYKMILKFNKLIEIRFLGLVCHNLLVPNNVGLSKVDVVKWKSVCTKLG